VIIALCDAVFVITLLHPPHRSQPLHTHTNTHTRPVHTHPTCTYTHTRPRARASASMRGRAMLDPVPRSACRTVVQTPPPNEREEAGAFTYAPWSAPRACAALSAPRGWLSKLSKPFVILTRITAWFIMQ
jgi:hypothetical protein